VTEKKGKWLAGLNMIDVAINRRCRLVCESASRSSFAETSNQAKSFARAKCPDYLGRFRDPPEYHLNDQERSVMIRPRKIVADRLAGTVCQK
jgi:hypothetical protein